MKTVKAEYRSHVCTHALGFCCECDLEWDVFHKGKSEMLKHVRKTGHRVNLETAYNQYYSLIMHK